MLNSAFMPSRKLLKQINQDDSTIVDYEFEITYDIFGQVATIHETATFNDDLLTTAVMTTDNGLEGHSVTISDIFNQQ